MKEIAQAAVVSAGTNYRHDIQAGAHALIADEPAHAGGSDAGPAPYELLLASLGACTAITLRMYADRKRWPLESVEVRMRQSHAHEPDCEACETDGRSRPDQVDGETPAWNRGREYRNR